MTVSESNTKNNKHVFLFLPKNQQLPPGAIAKDGADSSRLCEWLPTLPDNTGIQIQHSTRNGEETSLLSNKMKKEVSRWKEQKG